MDAYFEHMIKRKKNFADMAVIALVVLAGIVVIFSLFYFGKTPIASLVFPLQALVVYLVYRFIVRKNIEFEYCVTNDDLDIDKIINKQKRKRLETIKIKNIVSMAPVGSPNLMDITGRKITNITSGYPDRKIYCMVYGAEKAILFEPNKKIVEAMQQRNPKNIFID